MSRLSYLLPICLVLLFLDMKAHSSKTENFALNNHSVVFISGWAQSGTSFVHQILDHSNFISSMIEKCDAKLGKRCLNWNHEGQWILKGSTRLHFKSGFVYPIESYDTDTSKSIRDEWLSFWDLNLPVLVEKSPQSLLKFPALQDSFRHAVATTFVIVIKHPVTLNIATPRASDWSHYRNMQQRSAAIDPDKKPVDSAQKVANMEHFIKFMSINATTVANKQVETSLAWLPAMDELHGMLLKYNWTRESLRIIRYEDFSKPTWLCNKLFKFIFRQFGASLRRDGEQVCSRLFNQQVAVATSTLSDGYSSNFRQHSRSSNLKNADRKVIADPLSNRAHSSGNGRKLEVMPDVDKTSEYNDDAALESNNCTQSRRKLRLRTVPSSNQPYAEGQFVFRPDLVREASVSRMRGFWDTLKTLPPHQVKEINKINERLIPFGYDLFAPFFDKNGEKVRKNSLLAPWEL